MLNPSHRRLLTASFLIAGTTIGAGMIALPVMMSSHGFVAATLTFLAVWLVMIVASYLMIEANFFSKNPINLMHMAHDTLGPWGERATALVYVGLLYALNAAYLDGLSQMLNNALLRDWGLHLTVGGISIAIVVLLGVIVGRLTSGLMSLNRYLVIALIVAYLLIVAGMSPHVNTAMLLSTDNTHHLAYTWPVVFTAFGYQIVIPVIRRHLDNDPTTIKRAVWIGSAIPLLVYLLWLWVTLGSIPDAGAFGFAHMRASQNPSVDLSEAIRHLIQQPWLATTMQSFMTLAIVTSLIGTSISLYDFLSDGLEVHRIKSTSCITALTFIPSWLFVEFYPRGFILALSYSALFVILLLVLLPAILVLADRKHAPKYQPCVTGSRVMAYLAIAVSVCMTVICFMTY